ncbi:superoxide dismutase [Fe], chloroplastic isoform X1 [Capsicum annuum]|uniref:superoxide dismutase [Fe], chloroplastic isoform X1 n=1 Tax=Capsicum annuum TaxID=4072 RepID=UPI001FB0E0A5|nr:superoxide dismutase [Fe], chloroplastic isoform X1 [Capsicum annuum]
MAAANSLSLTSAFLPRHGFHGPSHNQNVQLSTQKKQFARKAVSGWASPAWNFPYQMFSVSVLEDALEPHMSSRTFEFHWGKHHRAYVDNLNKQIDGTELDGKTLEDIILITYNKGSPLPAFNNAAQAWNHQFFWESMKPNGGGEPSGKLLELINRDFGSYDTFVKEFKAAAATQFGSGWAWLAYKPEDKKLALVKTPNAENPLVLGYTALLTIDVWEHAYYLDFQNRRPDYISIFMEKLVSWEAVSSRLKTATA